MGGGSVVFQNPSGQQQAIYSDEQLKQRKARTDTWRWPLTSACAYSLTHIHAYKHHGHTHELKTN